MRAGRSGRVEGRVQGVGFRYHAQRQAEALGLGGWVQNLSDGSVAFEIRGEEAQVEAFLEWLERGPRLAKVRSVRVEPLDPVPDGPDSFELRR